MKSGVSSPQCQGALYHFPKLDTIVAGHNHEGEWGWGSAPRSRGASRVGVELYGAGTELTSGSVSPEPAEAVGAGAEQSEFAARRRRNPGRGWSGMGGGDTGKRGVGRGSDPQRSALQTVVLGRSQNLVLSRVPFPLFREALCVHLLGHLRGVQTP